ncbi:hypothetical protein KI387_010150, partial [Taxus chinensis]
MADESSEAMNVRFLINSKTRRIIYAEAGKDFVDLLFSFLTLPIGSVMKLLSESDFSKKLASVTNLYDSMGSLPSQFMTADKSELQDPKFLSAYANNTLRIEGGTYYVCTYVSHTSSYSSHNIDTHNNGKCVCGNAVNCPVKFRQNNQGAASSNQSARQESGYVKETVTFMITDDLKITASSTITSITLLNQLNIKDLTELEERTAPVDRNKALELLGASLLSNTVLND